MISVRVSVVARAINVREAVIKMIVRSEIATNKKLCCTHFFKFLMIIIVFIFLTELYIYTCMCISLNKMGVKMRHKFECFYNKKYFQFISEQSTKNNFFFHSLRPNKFIRVCVNSYFILCTIANNRQMQLRDNAI